MFINPINNLNAVNNNIQNPNFKAYSIITDNVKNAIKKAPLKNKLDIMKFEHSMDRSLEGRKPFGEAVIVDIANINTSELILAVNNKFLTYKYDVNLTEQRNAKLATKAYFEKIEPFL